MNLTSILEALKGFAVDHEYLTYVILGVSAFFENIFPPLPGDTTTLVGAFLVGTGSLNPWIVLTVTTIGSLLGFMTLFYIGYHYGRDYIIKKNWKTFNIDDVNKANKWFVKYGYFVILINRFMSGIRAIVSISAGIAKMSPKAVIAMSLFASLLWNGVILYFGALAGESLNKEDNLKKVDAFIKEYSLYVTIGISLIVLFFIVKWWIKRKSK
ncbi:MAG: DedA family protein [Spirochaetota bacterium]|nr:DedA family protein [Spirochaetota bacterium]